MTQHLETYEWLLITTAIPYGADSHGHIVIEGLGLDASSLEPYRAQIAWTFEEGKLIAAKGLINSTALLSRDITLISHNGKTAFILPAGEGSTAIVSYVFTDEGHKDTTGWVIEGVPIGGGDGTPFEGTAINIINTFNSVHQEVLVGSPTAWIDSIVPPGFLAYLGQTFDTEKFPILASYFPDGRLPDLSGDFLRAAEVGRTIFSKQSQSVQALSLTINSGGNHYHPVPYMRKLGYMRGGDSSNYRGYCHNQGNNKHNTDSAGNHSHSGTVKGTGSETRPANMSVLFITKAG